MSIAQSLLPEYDFEMASARKHLERVPGDDLGWQPHPKSMTLGRLAGHLAEIPGWVGSAFLHDSLNLAGDGSPRPAPPATPEAILAHFDRLVAAGREALAGASDEDMGKPWSLMMGERVLFTMPKGDVYRRWVISHLIHHRAQLGVYLRLKDIEIPGSYGPSADEA
jgi:uncharacterized damage-inducible protein DinB